MAKDKRGDELNVGDTVVIVGVVSSVEDNFVRVSVKGSTEPDVKLEPKAVQKLTKLKQEAMESLERAEEGARRGASGLTKSEYP